MTLTFNGVEKNGGYCLLCVLVRLKFYLLNKGQSTLNLQIHLIHYSGTSGGWHLPIQMIL